MRQLPTLGCRYEVVDAVLRDRRTRAPAIPPSDDAMFALLRRFMARLDGQRHHRTRAPFARIFTPKRTASYRQAIAERCERLLDAVEAQGQMDLVAAFARPLPFGVICEVLGVSENDQPWLETTMATLNASFAGQRHRANVERGNEATRSLLEYFDRQLSARSRDPADDLLSVLAADEAAQDAREDLLANCVFFLLAGHTTTTTLLAAGTVVLLEHPDQLEMLRADSGRWPAAVEELLRFLSPITITGVGLEHDVTVGDRTFTAGTNRLLCIAAANRDPDVFAEPDRFDIRRTPNPHLAFTVGPHHCVGAPLARLHGQVGLAELFHRYPGLRLSGPVEWIGSAPVRQLASAPVAW